MSCFEDYFDVGDTERGFVTNFGNHMLPIYSAAVAEYNRSRSNQLTDPENPTMNLPEILRIESGAYDCHGRLLPNHSSLWFDGNDLTDFWIIFKRIEENPSGI